MVIKFGKGEHQVLPAGRGRFRPCRNDYREATSMIRSGVTLQAPVDGALHWEPSAYRIEFTSTEVTAVKRLEKDRAKRGYFLSHPRRHQLSL